MANDKKPADKPEKASRTLDPETFAADSEPPPAIAAESPKTSPGLGGKPVNAAPSGPALAKAPNPQLEALVKGAPKAEAPEAKRPEIGPPPPAAAPTSATYRVWSHGTLKRNGTTYAPGDTLTLPCAVGDALECLSKV